MTSVEDSIQHLCKEIETGVRGVVHEILRSSSEDRLNAVRDSRTAAESEAARLLSAELARARAESAERLATQLARHRSEAAEALEVEVARAKAETMQALTSEMARQRAESAHAAAQEMERLRSEVTQAAAAELARVNAEATQALATEVTRRADTAAAAAVDLARMQQEASQALESEVMHARVEERQAVLAGVERLLQGMRRLDEAKTLTEVLDALADAVSEEAARVGMFVNRGARIQGWRFSGFRPEMADPRRVDFPTHDSGIVAEAIETGETCALPSRSGQQAAGGPPFAQLPEGRVALAVPVRLAGRTVAVVYADDMGEGWRPVPAAWPESIEILARHAGRCLEALTALKTSLTGAYRAAAAPLRSRAQDGVPLA